MMRRSGIAGEPYQKSGTIAALAGLPSAADRGKWNGAIGKSGADHRRNVGHRPSVGLSVGLGNQEEAAIPVVWLKGNIPLNGGQPCGAEDIAETVLFFASERSCHITGTPIFVDGGQGL